MVLPIEDRVHWQMGHSKRYVPLGVRIYGLSSHLFKVAYIRVSCDTGRSKLRGEPVKLVELLYVKNNGGVSQREMTLPELEEFITQHDLVPE